MPNLPAKSDISPIVFDGALDHGNGLEMTEHDAATAEWVALNMPLISSY
ncbi:hypothetical protein [Chania multitudinisentens]|nr:hypothetical protein [Chania multitudinisentens]